MNTQKKVITIIVLSIIFLLQLFTSVSAQENTNTNEVNTQIILDKLTAEEVEKLSEKHTTGTAGPEQFNERLTKKYYNQQNWSYNWGWNWFFFIVAILGFVSALLSRYSNLNKQTMPIAITFGGIFLISSIFILPNFLSIVFGFKGWLITLAYILIPILIIISFGNIKENNELSLSIMFILSVFSLSFIMPNVIYMIAEQTKWGSMYWFFWIASCFFFVEIAEAIFNSTEGNGNKILELEQQNRYLLSENNNLTNQVSKYKQIEQTTNNYKNQLQKIENDNSNLKNEIKKLTEIAQKVDRLENDNKTKEKEINQLSKDYNEATYNLKQLNDFNDQLEKDYIYLQTSYNNLDIISQQRREQLEENEKSIEQLEFQRIELQNKNAELENELIESEKKIEKLNRDIDNLQRPKDINIDKETIKQLESIYIKSTETGITVSIPFRYTHNNNYYRIKGISPSAFKNWDNLENIIFDTSSPIINIPSSTFEGCTKLKNITLPISIAKIENSAFKSCKSLTTIEIPNKTTNIGAEAFRECEKLEKINIPENVKNIQSYTFNGCYSLEKITLPKSLETIERNAFEGCTGLSIIEIPQNVKTIEQYAFNKCKNLKEINIPEGVKNIKPFTFSGCEKLEKITLPKSLETIERNAFEGCKRLTKIEIPQNLKTIEQHAFYDCNEITEMFIPNTVKNIGDDALSGIGTVYYNGNAENKDSSWGVDESDVIPWDNEDEYWVKKDKEEKEKRKFKSNKEDISIKFTCPKCGYNYEEEELSKHKKKVILKKNLTPKENKDS